MEILKVWLKCIFGIFIKLLSTSLLPYLFYALLNPLVLYQHNSFFFHTSSSVCLLWSRPIVYIFIKLSVVSQFHRFSLVSFQWSRNDKLGPFNTSMLRWCYVIKNTGYWIFVKEYIKLHYTLIFVSLIFFRIYE